MSDYLRPQDMETVKYYEIVELLADILPYKKDEIRSIINSFFRVMTEATYSGRKVSIPMFGVFRLVWVRGKWVLRFRQSWALRPRMREEQKRRGFS